MKKIEAIIRTSKLEDVHAALSDIGIGFMTFMDVKGYGLEHGATMQYRGAIFDMGYIPRTQLEIVIPEDRLDEVVDTLLSTASTDEIGDGKIFISSVDSAYRIRNRDRDEKAL